jgi:hypothetical protein
VQDSGVCTPLPDGTTLETGSMINPETGVITPYEELWKDDEAEESIFLKNESGTAWYAKVGSFQLGLGRHESDGKFWAWQAEKLEGTGWVIRHSIGKDMATTNCLPDDTSAWQSVGKIQWAGESFSVLE